MATDSSIKHWTIRSGFIRPMIVAVSGVLLTAMLLWYHSADTLWQESQKQRLAGMQAACGMLRDNLSRTPIDLSSNLDSLARVYGQITGMRVTLIALNGKVLGDNEQTSTRMENHSDRPEFQEALKGKVGIRRRISPTLNQSMVYLALPPLTPDAPIVRISSHLTGNPTLSTTAIYKASLFVFIALVLTLALAYYLHRPLVHSLGELKAGLLAIAADNLEKRISPTRSRHLHDLELAYIEAVENLHTRFDTSKRQIGEFEALLGSLVEGVLAIDAEERIITINLAASRMLGVDSEQIEHRTLLAAIRNHDLSRFVAMVLSAGRSLEDEIAVPIGERRLQLHGSPLIDAHGTKIGVVVALHDVTRLRRLEIVRRDFVANVSHELRTPITSIKGFVETLRDGAMDDPETAHRFMDIIARQVDRLNLIIEDLLVLARLEEGETTGGIEFVETSLQAAATPAVEALQAKAFAKEIMLVVGEGLSQTTLINAPLIEQALINLLDNAINYSPVNSHITIDARREGAFLLLNVSDQGIGIAPEHLPRLFERFYRVDRDRSRKLGGTGLGLAIVKHIARAHHGKVTVTSVVGRGSTFTLHLPTSL